MSVEPRLLAVCMLAGCGSLADGGYRGDVLMELSGRVMLDGSLPADGDLGVAVLWSRTAGVDPEAQSVVVRTAFPAEYEIQMFHPPSETERIELFGVAGLEAAVGEIIVYDDRDGNARWDASEAVVGGSYDATVLWVEDVQEGTLPGVNGGGWTPTKGFNLVYRIDAFSCINPWDAWLAELPTPQTDLWLGTYWPAVFDWDCDGEYSDPFQGQTGMECPDPQVSVAWCDQYAGMLTSPDGAAIDEQAQLLLNTPELLNCLLSTCPEVVDQMLTANGEPTGR